MKKFDLELAKNGRKVCTRDGREVRIICYDMQRGGYSIVALVKCANGEEMPHTYTKDGRVSKGFESSLDLFISSDTHTGWVNIYKGRDGYFSGYDIWETKLEALGAALNNKDIVDTIQITFNT